MFLSQYIKYTSYFHDHSFLNLVEFNFLIIRMVIVLRCFEIFFVAIIHCCGQGRYVNLLTELICIVFNHFFFSVTISISIAFFLHVSHLYIFLLCSFLIIYIILIYFYIDTSVHNKKLIKLTNINLTY